MLKRISVVQSRVKVVQSRLGKGWEEQRIVVAVARFLSPIMGSDPP
jgi:hypothetical protein